MSLDHRKKYVIIALILFLFIGSTQALKAEWTCEDAYVLCITTRWTVNNPGEAILCMMGYSFCKKYVEPFLK